MTTRARPTLKRLTPATTGQTAAVPAAPTGAVGGRKGVAEGVPTACRPDPHGDDGRRPVAWLHITAPGRGTVPSARSWCLCGRDRFTTGHNRVLALIDDHDHHRTHCPRRTASQEGQAA
ncbi:hypothetical protein [Streptomyces ficellus]|uniref:Uncharacterized protein n=1 Tax=Streptomyces ficellus TaxID=1977088 RepID=A0A6I6FKM6_9ACTN|nr:hypothetical protein [Streptomyces ficellus]QGV79785.1 hypothetical protein EIZ62_17225 [Streptomyces ficellus]